MAYNWSREIPEPTGDSEYDYYELYNWAIGANEDLKRILNRIGIDKADIDARLGGAGI